jgi:putative PIN family toxin of toxin-antitoxin system
MLDTNVIISAALFPNSISALAVVKAMREHTLLVCTYVIAEAQEVFSRKFPHKTASLDAFLSKTAFELCYTPGVGIATPDMRDETDRPILQAAIDAETDIILTGDNDFHALDILRPLVLTPADFLKNETVIPR